MPDKGILIHSAQMLYGYTLHGVFQSAFEVVSEQTGKFSGWPSYGEFLLVFQSRLGGCAKHQGTSVIFF